MFKIITIQYTIMIKIINLTKIFRTESVQTTALNEVSLEISQGEFVALSLIHI